MAEIGPLNQNLVREDKDNVIDSASKRDVADIIISGTKLQNKMKENSSKAERVIKYNEKFNIPEQTE